MNQLTSHILDTSVGTPAAGIVVILYQGGNDEWKELNRDASDSDGRLPGLVKNNSTLEHGIYKLRFETKDYFDKKQVKTFYPYVEIVFEIDSGDHYHVPLLLNPFGYSTYRGS